MKPYLHKVQYYETDMMGVAHHANYIRWMEEARVDFLSQLGFPYAAMEARGVVSPVVELSCRYRKPCTFGDEISVCLTVESFSGARMAILYDMCDENGAQVCSARSVHAFLDRSGRIVRMKKEMPQFCAAMEQAAGKQDEKEKNGAPARKARDGKEGKS